jgi:hypothetical protein
MSGKSIGTFGGKKRFRGVDHFAVVILMDLRMKSVDFGCGFGGWSKIACIAYASQPLGLHLPFSKQLASFFHIVDRNDVTSFIYFLCQDIRIHFIRFAAGALP